MKTDKPTTTLSDAEILKILLDSGVSSIAEACKGLCRDRLLPDDRVRALTAVDEFYIHAVQEIAAGNAESISLWLESTSPGPWEESEKDAE